LHHLERNKTISIFLILVFVLQLIPLKQVINYFFIDNQMTEEIAHTVKTPVKNFSSPDEDYHFLYDLQHLPYPYLSLLSTATGLYKDMLPSSHADDIETPPPNVLIS
jgi:hypothetical protein